MTGEKPPMSPAAMRDMAVKLIERAAELERENRRAASSGENIVPIEPAIGANWGKQAPEAQYPLHALAAFAKGMYDQRLRRNALFGINISQEPMWDILLDLYIERTAGKQVRITSACIASNVPATTALRYIALLEEAGLVHRIPDPLDSRATYIEITRPAYRKMAMHLNETYEAFSRATDLARASFAVVN